MAAAPQWDLVLEQRLTAEEKSHLAAFVRTL